MPRSPAIAAALLLALARGVLPAAAQGRGGGRSVLVVRVLDEQKRPLAGAFVTVGGVEHGGTSDASGQAWVTGIEAGNRLVEVRRTGYGFQRVAADFAGADTVRREVALAPAPVELEGITVTSWGRSMRLRRSGFYDRQRRGLGAFMGREQLDRIRPVHTIDAFRYMRGFLVLPVGPHQVVMGTRGGGCLPNVYVDGAQMFVRDERDQEQALAMVSPDDVEGIEAYQGPASIPAEYNPLGSVCGVILIWTRAGG
jgi:hypothetical protein